MRGVLMLSLGAAALAVVALVPVMAVTVGTAIGMAAAVGAGIAAVTGMVVGAAAGAGADGAGVGEPRVFVGPRYGGCWAPGYGWVTCRRWWW